MPNERARSFGTYPCPVLSTDHRRMKSMRAQPIPARKGPNTAMDGIALPAGEAAATLSAPRRSPAEDMATQPSLKTLLQALKTLGVTSSLQFEGCSQPVPAPDPPGSHPWGRQLAPIPLLLSRQPGDVWPPGETQLDGSHRDGSSSLCPEDRALAEGPLPGLHGSSS